MHSAADYFYNARVTKTLVSPSFSGTTLVSWHQDVFIMDFTGAKDDGSGGDD